LASVAVTVTVDVPAVVGVPLTTPAADRANPGGRVEGAVVVKMYDPDPPVAVTACEYVDPTTAGRNSLELRGATGDR